ncbi:MAG: MarR family transcriptional regulator [Porticoccaceae bacterium]
MTDIFEAPENEIEDTAEKLFFRLYQACNISVRRVGNILTEYNMSAQQFSVLGSLGRTGFESGLTVNEMVEYLMVSRQSLNGVLNRMEKAGYIKRSVNPDDQRSRKITLCPLGREVLDQVRPRLQAFYQKSLIDMSEEKRLDSIDSLNFLIQRMK